MRPQIVLLASTDAVFDYAKYQLAVEDSVYYFKAIFHLTTETIFDQTSRWRDSHSVH